MNVRYIILIMLIAATNLSAATGAKDPRYRNEDISKTEVSVDYAIDEYGNYIYKYTVKSPDSNLGHIISLNIDISCEKAPHFPDFNESLYPSPLMGDSSEDDLHLPVVVNAPYGEAALFGIDADNTVGWGVFLDPGQTRQGLTIISPAPPGSRGYYLLPSMDTNGWDYSGYDESDDLPWVDDFTVYGTTIGPACPGEEQNEPRFAGTLMPDEAMNDNQLLTYSKPLSDHITRQVGVGQVAITIHYADTISPGTFTVNPGPPTIPPQSDPLQDLFHPQPGTSETVNIPIGEEQKLELRVSGQPTNTSGKQSANEMTSSARVDLDVFYIQLE